MNSIKKKSLFLFTIGFPFTESETFLSSEFLYLLKSFDNIDIISSANKTKNEYYKERVKTHSLNDIIMSENKSYQQAIPTFQDLINKIKLGGGVGEITPELNKKVTRRAEEIYSEMGGKTKNDFDGKCSGNEKRI